MQAPCCSVLHSRCSGKKGAVKDGGSENGLGMCRMHKRKSQEGAHSEAWTAVVYSLCCPFVASFPPMHLCSPPSDEEFYLESHCDSRWNKTH